MAALGSEKWKKKKKEKLIQIYSKLTMEKIKITASDIARLFNVHRTTISRLLLKNGSLTEQLDKITGHF